MTNQSPSINFSEIDFDPFEDLKEIEKIVLINEPQREIWLSCIIGGNPASLAYNESVSLDLKGTFHFDVFKKAFSKVVKRHEALRSVISSNGENLIIYDDQEVVMDIKDFSSETEAGQQDALSKFIKNEMSNPFNLQEGPLFRVFVHKLSDNHHYFTLVIHHIIGDGWSIGIILEDLSKFYNAYAKGLPISLPNNGPQISSYAEEQAAFLNSADFKKIENFWLETYQGIVPVLDLPTDNPRPVTRSYKANRIDHKLPIDLINQLKETGIKAGCSFVNVLLSAFEIFLCQVTKQSNIVVGLPAAGQSATENFELVGHCVNLLPLKTTINLDVSFNEYLKDRKNAFFDAYDHQQFSFGQLIKKLSIKRDSSRIPLVPVVFNIDMGMDSAVSFENLHHKLVSNPREYETFEIFLNATGSKEAFTLEWTYNSQLFNASTIERMTNEFELLLKSLAQNPDIELQNIISHHKEPVQLEEGYSSEIEKNVVQLINQVALLNPSKVAVSFNNEKLSYAELISKANQLALLLIKKGIKTGDIVALAADRSTSMMVSLLGILKAGAVYVPLDPEYPHERIEFMLEDSSAKILLVSSKHKNKYHSKAIEIIIEDVWSELDNYAHVDLIREFKTSDLAYILYTSGSTGKPKGVKITHKNLANFLLSMQKYPGISSDDRLLAITTISFDIAGLELYLPLIAGAQVIIADADSIKDGRILLDLIDEHLVSIMQATPSTWQMMIDSGWEKKYPIKILTGGEALPKELSDRLLTRSNEVWNMYGPTETTIWSAIKRITSQDRLITIGLPIDHTEIYVLDEKGNTLPVGMPGEIYIGGFGVADGYLNRQELTSEKFVLDSFNKSNGSKLYRTGDLGKLLENGEFQCLGRIDQQVKIRGHRIELGEIESILSSQQNVKQSVVVAQGDAISDKRLIAYVTLNDNGQEDSLSWKDRWDTLYNIGAESRQNLGISDQNLDDTLLEHYKNKTDLAAQSSQWLQASVERIKQLNPKRIYEIGSGAGQLLFELAPQADYYVATDYAETAIEKLNEKILSDSEKWGHVKAMACPADDFSFVSEERFDLILLHSVAQYFPNAKYLIDVIKKSVAAIDHSGCIFIGDMQGKNTLEMCHAMDYLPNSSDENTLAKFKETVLNRVKIEDEFVADPEFFYNLQKLIPSISGIDIQLRRGQLLNETTKYHYDVWLYVGKTHHEKAPEIKVDWKDDQMQLDKVRHLLTANTNSVLEVKNVLNSRTAPDYKLLQLINSENSGLSIKHIKKEISALKEGLDPDIFWNIGTEFNFKAYIKWSTDGTDGTYDVTFIPLTFENALPQNPYKSSLESDIYNFARTPFSKNEILLSKEVIQNWKQELYKTLPTYMIPEEFVALKSFPLTPNAKIDRNALPIRISKKAIKSGNGLSPKTKNEQIISDIWLAALELENIKTDDDFFELGGHSLLAVKVMVAIEKETGKRLPLATLFENSTIEKLALQLCQDNRENSYQSIVPIKTVGTKDPIFLIHGGGLNILLFKSIIEHLDEDQPIYGIQALGLNKETEIPPTIEGISKKLIDEILKVQPNGPYSFAGYSLGGFIAFEIAKQLKEMGKEIKILGVIDTYAGSNSGQETKLNKLATKVQRQFYKVPFFTKSFIHQPKETLEYQFKIIKDKFEALMYSTDSMEKDIFTGYEKEIYKIYSKALSDYVLAPSNLRVTLFRVEKRLYYLDDLVSLGWNNFAKEGVDIKTIPGDHKTFLHSPNDKIFAQILQKTIDKG
ncbi:non-ribosomal peptide synthetase [Pedobacter sp. V48]|uniref:non-ribosomal peptide synthetase n=1 Tax=Pedobacter sp. V48 TaxID=509635 RepID=UPI0003E45896|nr:non-ribosomal peptide synthetase [Pedobacter sp. V48]ETZ22624.1 hypothetical protein N824_22380 [Pedobacter sp. V48]